MHAEILPLAIGMMAGPQIMSSLLLAISKRPVANSFAFIAAVFAAVSVGVSVYLLLGNALGQAVTLHGRSGPTNAAKIVQLVLVGILVLLAVRSFLGRKSDTRPKWMDGLVDATPKRAFTLGLLLIFLAPADIITMLTVGVNLASNNLAYRDAMPFLLLTTFVAALPLIGYFLLFQRSYVVMPKARDWVNQYGWLVNIVVYALFIVLIL